MAGAIAWGQTNKRVNKTKNDRKKQASKQSSKRTNNETEIIHVEKPACTTYFQSHPGLVEVDAWLGRPPRGVFVFKLKFHKDKIIVDVEFQKQCV